MAKDEAEKKDEKAEGEDKKLEGAEGEAAETQTWLEFAVRCEYLKPEGGRALFRTYDEIISMLVSMINKPQTWVLPSGQRRTKR